MPSDKTIARATGAAYFCMLPGGLVGFLYARPKIFDADSAAVTLANLGQNTELARVGLAATLLVIVAQALSALGFYALFQRKHPVAALGICGFGLVNAAAILAGAAASWAALEMAVQPDALSQNAADLVYALYLFDGNAWKIGGLFFGLWLIPMGWAAMRSGFFHAGKVLGWVLMVGGVGYVLSSFVALLPAVAETGIADLLAMPATVGELWMIFALLVVGVRGARGSLTT